MADLSKLGLDELLERVTYQRDRGSDWIHPKHLAEELAIRFAARDARITELEGLLDAAKEGFGLSLGRMVTAEARVVELENVLREQERDYESKVLAVIDRWIPDHAEGCDEGSTQYICLRCDVRVNLQVAFGFSRSLAVRDEETT